MAATCSMRSSQFKRDFRMAISERKLKPSASIFKTSCPLKLATSTNLFVSKLYWCNPSLKIEIPFHNEIGLD